MSNSVEQRLQAIEDVLTITKLKAAYCEGADSGTDGPCKPDRIAELFVEDGVWETGEFGRCEGREAIRERFRTLSSPGSVALHCVTNPSIDVEGDTASARWHVILLGSSQQGSILMGGVYRDEFVRTAQGWKFKSLKFVPGCVTSLAK